MFNFWRRYPRWKPKLSGRYQCTVRCGRYGENLEVLDLYFDRFGKGTWIDDRRVNVFDGYNIYKRCRMICEENRVYDDILCDRTRDVIAWRRLSKPKTLRLIQADI